MTETTQTDAPTKRKRSKPKKPKKPRAQRAPKGPSALGATGMTFTEAQIDTAVGLAYGAFLHAYALLEPIAKAHPDLLLQKLLQIATSPGGPLGVPPAPDKRAKGRRKVDAEFGT